MLKTIKNIFSVAFGILVVFGISVGAYMLLGALHCVLHFSTVVCYG